MTDHSPIILPQRHDYALICQFSTEMMHMFRMVALQTAKVANAVRSVGNILKITKRPRVRNHQHNLIWFNIQKRIAYLGYQSIIGA